MALDGLKQHLLNNPQPKQHKPQSKLMKHEPIHRISNSPIVERQKQPRRPQQLSKAMSEALYSLFGPNGQSVPVHKSENARLAAFMELQRHGIVELRATPEIGLFNVLRRQRDLKEKDNA